MNATGETSSRAWLRERVGSPPLPGSILLHAHSSAFQAPGGGENQLVQTARALDALGHAVRPFVPWVDRLEDGRLLHLFGMSREGLELARVAKRRGVPVVLSTICWIEPSALRALAPSAARGWIDSAKWAAKRCVPALGWRSELVRLADVLAPNSRMEGDQLVRYLGADPSRIVVVPNGVDARFAEARGARERRTILYVGRIEPRKNVLGLVRAAKGAGLPLRVIGGEVPGHEGYAAACRREGPTVDWTRPIGYGDPRLVAAYAEARVFALPSWFETPGLAALEAAMAGVPIVVTPFGCTREYFGDRVRYARPGRPRELERALVGAWDAEGDAGLAGEVERRYLWAAVARRTAEMYDQVAPSA